jgi:type 1 glutamine amidotransferase
MKSLLIAMTLGILASTALAADKKIVFLAGKPSHGPGEHEHRAGSLLLADCLTKNVPGVSAVVVSNGWPTDESVFKDAAAIIVYCDGGKGHALLQGDRLKTIGALMDRGVGLACLHYAVEPTRECGQTEFMDWIGGSFEIHWSVNPHWMANFKSIPAHPITRGVEPFQLYDEWYFNMRFRTNMTGVTPILSAVPTPGTIKRNDGPHSNNPHVRESVERGDAQHLAWAAERPNGGRGVGYTGGHFHKSWGDENARRLVLNAILWLAKVEVPANGVQSTVTPEQLAANQDDKGKR